MAQGVIGGMAAGLIAAAAGLTVASILSPQPAGDRPPAAPQVQPPVAAEEPLGPEAAPANPEPVPEATASVEAPKVPGPPAAALGGELAAAIDSRAAAPPRAGDEGARLALPPATEDEVPRLAAAPERPVRPPRTAMLPEIPAAEPRPAMPAPVSSEEATVAGGPVPGLGIAGRLRATGAAEALTDEGAAGSAPRIELRGAEAGLPGVPVPARVDRPILPAAATLPAEAEGPALDLHAAAQPAADAVRPVLSVVLLDEGRLGDAAMAAVAALPVPVSVALDPARAGAAAAMAAYRAQGVEVLALAALPPRPAGAPPADAGRAYDAIFGVLPETVAVLDLGAGGIEGPVAGPALARLAEDGRGAVMPAGGLGTGLRAAQALGVPAATFLRDLDGAGQDARVIRRFLDDAARRAGQDGPVILLGRVRPETLAALAQWSGSARAREVTMAPVSTALRAAEVPS